MNSRKIGNLIDPTQQLHTVSLPDPNSLSQNVNKHLESIQSNVMTGYAQIMQTIQANDDARMSDYQYKLRKAQADAENGGSGLGSALSSISKTLLEAYGSYQQAELTSKELDLKATQIENEVKASEQAAAQKAEIERAKAQSDSTKAALITTIDQMVTATQGFIRDYGYAEGVNKAQTELNNMFQSEAFKNLSPEDQIQVTSYYRSHFGDIQKNQTSQAVQQQKEYEASQADYDTTFIRTNFAASVFADIENGVDPNGAIARFEEGVAAWKKSVEDRLGRPIDPAYMMKVLNPVYADLATRMEKMYGSRAKDFSTAGKYMELSEYAQGMYLAQQQQAVNPATGQPFTEAEVATLIEQKGISLGIPSYVDRLEVTPSKITEREITRLEQAKALEALLNANDTPIRPDSIIGKAALNASTGSVLYPFINRDAGSIAFVAHIKNNRNQYPAHLQNLPELAEDFGKDRDSYLNLGKQLLELEQKAYAITTRTDPETLGQRNTLVPPNPELGTGGGYVDVSGSPAPSALREERESILKQMDVLKSQQVELQQKWAAFGLDVTNPANKSYLEALQLKSAGVQAKADVEAVERINTEGGGEGGTPGVTVVPSRDPATIRNRAVYNASRRHRTSYNERGERISVEPNVRAWATENNINPDRAVEWSNKTSNAIDELEKLLAKGVPPEEALRQATKMYNNTLSTPRAGEEQAHDALKEMFGRQFVSLSKNIVNSYNYYMRELSVPRGATTPRNPSGGSATTTPSRNYPTPNSEYERRDGMVTPFQGTNHQLAPTPDNSFGLPNAVTYDFTGKQNVNSISDGKVVYIGTQNGKPITIIKTHNGLYEGYVGIETPYRKVGDTVKANTPLGSVNSQDSSVDNYKPTGMSYAPNKNPMSDRIEQEFDTILTNSGNRGVSITSTHRTPESQVNAMVANVNSMGLQSQLNLYGAGGDAVLLAYANARKAGMSDAQARQAAVDKLKEIGFNSVSAHLSGRALDVSPASVRDRAALINELEEAKKRGVVTKYILPGGGEPVIHIEFAENLLGRNGSLSMVVWGSNPVLQNGILSPNTVSAQQYLQTKTGAYYPANNRNRQGESPSSMFRLSRTTYLLPNGKVLDLETNTIRVATQSEEAAVSNGYKPTVTKVGGRLSVNAADYGTGANNPEDDYGYKPLKDDPEFRRELAKLADELGIPAVFLADLMQVETANWTHVKRANQWGYYGLIQISPTNARAYAGMSIEQVGKLTLGQQVRLVVRPYLLAMQREAGRKIKTIEDLLFSVWRGSPGLRMNDQQRAKVRDGLNGVTAQEYLDMLGSAAGRQYNHFLVRNNGRALHKNPRTGCPQCQTMKQKGTFVVHYG